LCPPAVQLLADEPELNWREILSGCTPEESVHLAIRTYGIGRRIDIARIDIDTVKRWLQVCDRDHRDETQWANFPSCSPMKTGDLLDFSVLKFIDVELDCVTQWTSKASPIYLALSYVWGSSDKVSHLKLTQDTSSWLLTPGGLDKSDELIPCTILDAMALTKRLGRRYLWVDALCIQQDDIFDKRRQIPLMGAVYSQADCTIVAGTGTDAWSGLPGVGKCRVGRQHVAHVKGFDLVTSRQHFRDWVRNSVWDTRGWTLQERVCSRRMLIFTESQVFFRCRSSLLYEDTNLESNAMNIGRHPALPTYVTDISDVPFIAYRSIVTDLCQRSFGYDNDILNAFKGVEMWLHNSSVRKREDGAKDLYRHTEHFHWGFPESTFDAVICWSFPVHNPTWRRVSQSFPGWCWAGWRLQPQPPFGKLLLLGFPGPHSEVSVELSWFVFDENSGLRRLRTLAGQKDTLSSGVHNAAQHEVSPKDLPVIPSHIPKHHLLFFWTTEALLTVDRNGREFTYRQLKDPSLQNYTFVIRNPYTGDQIEEITLHNEWRSQQPDKLSFIAVAKACQRNWEHQNPDLGWYVMLVEWVDGIAHRIQTLPRPITNKTWDMAVPQRRLVSLV
jgi:hypothetical protein